MYTLQTYMGEGPKYTFPRQKDNHSDAEDECISKKPRDIQALQLILRNLIIAQVGLLYLYLN